MSMSTHWNRLDPKTPHDRRGGSPRGNGRTHAEVANLCALRYAQTKDARYRSLVQGTAQRYLELDPILNDPGDPGWWRALERVIGGETPVYPVAMGQAIKLMLNAYETVSYTHLTLPTILLV